MSNVYQSAPSQRAFTPGGRKPCAFCLRKFGWGVHKIGRHLAVRGQTVWKWFLTGEKKARFNAKKHTPGHRRKCAEAARRRRAANPEKYRLLNRSGYWKNPERARMRTKEYAKNNREKIEAKRLQKYWQDPESARAKVSTWAKANRDKINAAIRRRKAASEGYRILWTLRYRTTHALRLNKSGRATKAAKTETMLGCSVAFFKQWIEGQFRDGMTWGNHGDEWHLDHIIPCASFDLTHPEQQLRCFHYTNLQPLWKADNLKKGDIVIPHQPEFAIPI